jgi:hypothetical protein
MQLNISKIFKNAKVRLFKIDDNYYSIDEIQYEKIAEASINQLGYYLIDPSEKIRKLALKFYREKQYVDTKTI